MAAPTQLLAAVGHPGRRPAAAFQALRAAGSCPQYVSSPGVVVSQRDHGDDLPVPGGETTTRANVRRRTGHDDDAPASRGVGHEQQAAHH